MLYSLVLVTVSAHFTSCLGNYVNEKSCFNDFLTEYSYVKSVQHRWKLPKFFLQCNCSSEAFTVLSEYFHKVTSITTCSHLHQGCTFPCRKRIFPSPSSTSCCGRCRVPCPREDMFQRKDQNTHLKTKECTQRIELTKRVCLGFFPFPFTWVHACVVYIL